MRRRNLTTYIGSVVVARHLFNNNSQSLIKFQSFVRSRGRGGHNLSLVKNNKRYIYIYTVQTTENDSFSENKINLFGEFRREEKPRSMYSSKKRDVSIRRRTAEQRYIDRAYLGQCGDGARRRLDRAEGLRLRFVGLERKQQGGLPVRVRVRGGKGPDDTYSGRLSATRSHSRPVRPSHLNPPTPPPTRDAYPLLPFCRRRPLPPIQIDRSAPPSRPASAPNRASHREKNPNHPLPRGHVARGVFVA